MDEKELVQWLRNIDPLTAEREAALTRARLEGRIEGMEEAQEAMKHSSQARVLIGDLITAVRAAIAKAEGRE